ncbi:MAG: DUF3795 domain-containing protein [Oscillospiraceae bacterium]|nr:DUF3795 domain-containing protein [Oscillospiraceae bacterium]
MDGNLTAAQKFDKKFMAYCGDYSLCDWKSKIENGEVSLDGVVCDKAKCCAAKGYEHCGFCPELPCQTLSDMYAHPEWGDNGSRLSNLKNWAKGNYVFELRN